MQVEKRRGPGKPLSSPFQPQISMGTPAAILMSLNPAISHVCLRLAFSETHGNE